MQCPERGAGLMGLGQWPWNTQYYPKKTKACWDAGLLKASLFLKEKGDRLLW